MKKATAQMALDLLAPLYLGMVASRNSDGSDDASIINIREAVAALEADIAQPVEPVAYIGHTWCLYWAGAESIASIARRHNLKVGDKLYAAPQEAAVNAELLEALIHIQQVACSGSPELLIANEAIEKATRSAA